MAHRVVPGLVNRRPDLLYFKETAVTSVLLDLTGETCFMTGYLMLPDPTGGSKTISAAGGGAISWQTVAVTFANAGTTVTVGLQDVSTTASPTQGDGTFDVSAALTGGSGAITANAYQQHVMTSGSKTLAHGDLVTVCIQMTARAGADAVNVQCARNGSYGDTMLLPVVTSNTTGVYARVANTLPYAGIYFDDGTVGWILPSPPRAALGAAISVNVSTATTDEYANVIKYESSFMAMGLGAFVSVANNSADFELILYKDPMGTPSVLASIAVDATQLGVAAGTFGEIEALFPTPVYLEANVEYGLSIRPTTTNNITIITNDGVFDAQYTGEPNLYCYAIKRLDNTGAFSPNGASTKVTRVWAIGTHMEQGVNNCGGQIGVF